MTIINILHVSAPGSILRNFFKSKEYNSSTIIYLCIALTGI